MQICLDPFPTLVNQQLVFTDHMTGQHEDVPHLLEEGRPVDW